MHTQRAGVCLISRSYTAYGAKLSEYKSHPTQHSTRPPEHPTTNLDTSYITLQHPLTPPPKMCFTKIPPSSPPAEGSPLLGAVNMSHPTPASIKSNSLSTPNPPSIRRGSRSLDLIGQILECECQDRKQQAGWHQGEKGKMTSAEPETEDDGYGNVHGKDATINTKTQGPSTGDEKHKPELASMTTERVRTDDDVYGSGDGKAARTGGKHTDQSAGAGQRNSIRKCGEGPGNETATERNMGDTYGTADHSDTPDDSILTTVHNLIFNPLSERMQAEPHKSVCLYPTCCEAAFGNGGRTQNTGHESQQFDEPGSIRYQRSAEDNGRPSLHQQRPIVQQPSPPSPMMCPNFKGQESLEGHHDPQKVPMQTTQTPDVRDGGCCENCGLCLGLCCVTAVAGCVVVYLGGVLSFGALIGRIRYEDLDHLQRCKSSGRSTGRDR